MTSFSDLGLIGPLLKALATEGYAVPTPIQCQAIPPVLEGRDLLGIAQTGTGKTAAFVLPILQKLAQDPRPCPRKGTRALILSPTRELARQIAESVRTYGRFMKLHVAVVFGGVPIHPQIRQLAHGVDVLVATPGRLLDHIDQRTADIRCTEIFVLDEADQMLDLGFVVPIRKIVKSLPHQRQNLFFSATMPGEIGSLASELLREPVQVRVAPAATVAERVEQRVMLIEASRKRALLIDLLADPSLSRVLVFARTKHGADKVGQALAAAGVVAAVIHGNKSQSQRIRALEGFRAGATRVLVATDIAARGIDIDGVTHVINFDLPDVAEAYVHRIGRTARAGAGGHALAFCSNEERHLLREIEKLTRQQLSVIDRRSSLEGESAVGAMPARQRANHRPPRGDGARPKSFKGRAHHGHHQNAGKPTHPKKGAGGAKAAHSKGAARAASARKARAS